MNREEVIKILTILKTAYPKYYANMTKEEAENTIALYIDMFKDDNPTLVAMAIKQLITHLQFPPTIADIKQEMFKLTETEKETPIDLWNKLKKAISNSTYNSAEEFKKLPPVVQRFVGSPARLREYALGDSEVNNTVVKGQFLKQIELIQKSNKEEKMLLPDVKFFLGTIGKDLNQEIKQIGG